MKNSNKKGIIIGAVVLAALIAVFGVVFFINRPATNGGEKRIVIEVKNSNGDVSDYDFATDAEYLKEGAKVDVKISGATDGTPIRSKIAYNGEYGDFTDKPITLNGAPYNITVTQKSGVTTNAQLAFLRTQGVEDFLKTQVEPLKHTENAFQEFAVENKEKGGGYRRVSVEMTIRGAFAVETEKTEKP